jgi:hypothetical protein
VNKNCDISEPILFRGMKVGGGELFGKRQVRKDRKPKDTNIHTHNMLDELFYKEFGIKARSQSVFSYLHSTDVAPYIDSVNDKFIIIPLTPAVYIWSPSIDDLKVTWDDYESTEGLNTSKEEDIEYWTKKINSEYKKSNSIPNTHNEIMCYCSEYFFIQQKFLEKSVLGVKIHNNMEVEDLLSQIQKYIKSKQ